MKILIAEDDLTSQLMIKAAVFKAGYEPIVTGDGLSAYEILSKPGAPKLAILDWMMPGLDGVEVCRKIRAKKTNEPAYLILLTSRDKKEDIIQGLKAGADDYIVKPYNAEELQVRIDVGRKVVELQGSLVGQINELERLRMAVNQSIDGFAVASLDGYIQFVNPAWAQMHGYPVAELIGKHLSIFHTEEQLRREVIPFNEQAMKKGCHKGVVGHIHRDGTVFYTLMTSSILMDANKKPIGFAGTAHDITDLKQAEEALRESEQELRLTLNATTDGIWKWNFKTDTLFFSPRYYTMLGYDPGEFPASFETWKSLIHPDDLPAAMRVTEDYLATKKDRYKNEFRLRTKAGGYRWIHARAKVVERDERGSAVRMIGSHEDITERKQVEDALRVSLHEKELLIREVHHRVKNNMQIISSLLQLQSDHMNDDTPHHLFTEAKNRIRSMALVHEKLYNTENMATLDFAAYVKDLAIHLFRSYGINDNRVHFRLEAGEVKLGMDDAVPVALMLNELISNSLKHAFPDKRKGEIFLRLEDRQGKVTIELTDNGIGMPDGVRINSTETLGLKVVQALIEQLKGSIKLARRGGTRFMLSFKKK